MSETYSASRYSLQQLGWGHYFQQQLSLDELEQLQPARVVVQHKNSLILLTVSGQLTVPLINESLSVTVGDWVLLNKTHRIEKCLERKSLFRRKSAGSKIDEQKIAANVDTVFIVTSLNDDFNLNRIERYLVLAHEAGVEPVIILTKSDLCASQTIIEDHIRQVQSLDPLLPVIAINGLDQQCLTSLLPWCQTGKTLSVLGSSGVGKSTLVNVLLGQTVQSTQAIREDDAKGRHTTTHRSLHIIDQLPATEATPTAQVTETVNPPIRKGKFPRRNEARQQAGPAGIIIDTPGMRELQLSNSEDGLEETFSDIIHIAQACRFADCQHHQEPGCAVQAAITAGQLTLRRLNSYHKLQKEDEINSASLAEKRSKDKKLSKLYRNVQKEMRQHKKR